MTGVPGAAVSLRGYFNTLSLIGPSDLNTQDFHARLQRSYALISLQQCSYKKNFTTPIRISDSFHDVQDYYSHHRCRQRSLRCCHYCCNVLYSDGEKGSSSSFKHDNLHNLNNFCASSRSSKPHSSTSLDSCSCRPCGFVSIRFSWSSSRPRDAIGLDLFLRSAAAEPFVGRRAYHSRLATTRRRRSQEFKLCRRPINTGEIPRKVKGFFPLRL